MSACIEWTGAITAAGYGVLRVGDHPEYAHRIAYEEAFGPIPEGLEIDHVRKRGCRLRHCVNPEHLEAVTHAENMRRGYWGIKAECPQGHLYNEANTIKGAKGGRQCRACKEQRQAARRAGPARSKTPENRLASGHCRPCNNIKQSAYKARKRAGANA